MSSWQSEPVESGFALVPSLSFPEKILDGRVNTVLALDPGRDQILLGTEVGI